MDYWRSKEHVLQVDEASFWHPGDTSSRSVEHLICRIHHFGCRQHLSLRGGRCMRLGGSKTLLYQLNFTAPLWHGLQATDAN